MGSATLATKTRMTIRTRMANMGLRSIIPVLGMILRSGSMIGSVTRWRS
jgi:hypothetical protein